MVETKKECVDTNQYRVLKMCSNCPFRDNGKAIHLDEGRVDQIKEQLLTSDEESFSCHKTVYDLDKNMNEGPKQKNKMCAGAYEYLKSVKRPNIMMRLAWAMGIDTQT